MAKVNWYGEKVIDVIEKGAMDAIKEGCFMVEGDAKILCPVDTGRLRSSISSNWTGSGMGKGKVEPPAKPEDGVSQPTKKLTGRIGSNVEYARVVELGSEDPKYRRAPHAYLRPALHKNEQAILALFKKIIQGDYMQVLFQGIWNEFNNDTDLKAAVTGMYFTEAPQGTAYPYIVYFEISNVPSWTFTEDMENFLIQFSIYDNNSSSTNILSIFEKLKACYDWCDLSVSGYSHIYMRREFDILTRENEVWHFSCQYRTEIQK